VQPVPNVPLPYVSRWSTFQCTVTPGGTSAARVEVAGELDLLTAPQLASALREAQLNASLVVLDAREVTFIDSAGVHVILDASRDSDWGGARLVVATSAVVDRFLGLAGVTEQVSTFDISQSVPGRAEGASPAMSLLRQPGDQVDRGRDDERPECVGEQRMPQGRSPDVGGLQVGV
jgi:anti-sigma B factor antagonist